MEVGCYTLDLYCDNAKMSHDEEMEIHEYKEFPHAYSGHTYNQCRSQARKDGWLFKKDGTRICPKCSPKRK